MPIQITCSNVGLSGATVFYKEVDGVIEARQAIAILGDYQMKQEHLEAINYDPFHDDFHDNFVRGKGKTKDEALQAMKQDLRNISESIWF